MRWIWITLSSLAVIGAVAAVIHFFPAREPEKEQEEEAKPRRVRAEHQYYVLLPRLEVEPDMEDGSAWDSGGSPPDIYYEIHWQGHEVFRSTKKAGTLVAQWSNVSLDVRDLFSSISLDDSIKAARITVRLGDKLHFKVFDDDFANDELIGEWEFEVDWLLVGDQRWERPGGRLKFAYCRVLPLDEVEFETLTK